MRGELKEKVARGVAWSIAEKAGTMLLQIGVSLITLRLLMPEDFGVMAMLTAFAAVALIVVDSGFSQTLIRKQEPEPGEYKSVFIFNILTSVVLYFVLVGVTPLAAQYYDMPILTQLAPVFFLLLPVNALCVIQNTILTRRFRFALLSKVTFVSSLISGLIAVAMALGGCGVWSIVAQRLSAMVVRAVLLWWISDWRPSAVADNKALREMSPYSLRLMTTDLINTFYNKVPQLFLGRMYDASMLGYFDQAVKLKDMPLISAMQAVQSVTFPAFSKIGNEEVKFAESYRQVVMIVAFALFPVMAGMIALADEIPTFVGDKWLPAIPYFKVACLSGFFYPIAMIAYNVLKVRSDGRIIVRLEVAKKIIMTLILAVTIFHSVMAVMWGLVAMACIEMCLNVKAARRFSTLAIRRILRTLLPIFVITMVMFIAVWSVGPVIYDPWLRLIVKVTAGIVVYGGLSALFRLEPFREVLAMLRRQLRRE